MKQQTPNRFIRIKEVISLTGLSKSYIYQLAKTNQFPKQINLIDGGTSVAWLESEIKEWLESRVKSRDQNQ